MSDNNLRVDQKIKSILKELREAHKRSEAFYGEQIFPGKPIEPKDIFNMALAFESEERLLVDLDLAYSEKHPDRFSQETIDFLKAERRRLTYRIRAWQNRQFPGRYIE